MTFVAEHVVVLKMMSQANVGSLKSIVRNTVNRFVNALRCFLSLTLFYKSNTIIQSILDIETLQCLI